MTAPVRTPWRPDDAPRRTNILAIVPAESGHEYVLERRRGRCGGGVIRLAREQANGAITSMVFAPDDARRVAAALFAAAARLDIEGTLGDLKT